MKKFREYFPENLFPGKPFIKNFNEDFFKKYNLVYLRGYHVYLTQNTKYEIPIITQLNYNKNTKNIELTIRKEKNNVKRVANNELIEETFNWLLIFDKTTENNEVKK